MVVVSVNSWWLFRFCLLVCWLGLVIVPYPGVNNNSPRETIILHCIAIIGVNDCNTYSLLCIKQNQCVAAAKTLSIDLSMLDL